MYRFINPIFKKESSVRSGLNYIALVFAFSLLCSSCSREAPDLTPSQLPEEQLAEEFMISASNPLAIEAGLNILRKGGNAVDAAVAVQMMLTFVDPPESGLGGGAFLLHFDGLTGNMRVFDGRETAPAATEPDRFTLWGFPLPLWLALPSGTSTGVPGTVAMLYEAHSQHGKLPWEMLFTDAIEAAREGVPYPEQLLKQVKRDYSLQLFGDMRRYFVYQSRGDNPELRNPELAETLALIAANGPDAFYTGDIAEDFVHTARSRFFRGSDITTDDLASYAPVEREPVCGSYRDYTICGVPPPSSGGITLLQILGILEHFDMASAGAVSAESAHLIAEASRLAFADRYFYIGDPDFTDVPTQALIDPAYLESRAALINPEHAKAEPGPGQPETRIPELDDVQTPDEEESTGTTHFSIVDGKGNLVSMTSSIESPFGSRKMSRGYLLNNQLTDFTFRYEFEGGLHPNAPESGKRPRSSMAPVFVFDPDGDLRLVLGSRGGSRIIGYVAKTLIGIIDWNLTVQEAISLPNIVHRGNGLELEYGTDAALLKTELEAKGHNVQINTMESGIHGIEWLKDSSQWRGGADPRLGGAAKGE